MLKSMNIHFKDEMALKDISILALVAEMATRAKIEISFNAISGVEQFV